MGNDSRPSIVEDTIRAAINKLADEVLRRCMAEAAQHTTQLAPISVSVKELPWVPVASRPFCIGATTPFGDYIVQSAEDGTDTFDVWLCGNDVGDCDEDGLTLSDAKKYCQNHYVGMVAEVLKEVKDKESCGIVLYEGPYPCDTQRQPFEFRKITDCMFAASTPFGDYFINNEGEEWYVWLPNNKDDPDGTFCTKEIAEAYVDLSVAVKFREVEEFISKHKKAGE